MKKARLHEIIREELHNVINEGSNANRWFDNLKFYYEKGLKSPDLKDPAEKKIYIKLAKQFFRSLKEGLVNESIVPDLYKSVPDNYAYNKFATDIAMFFKEEYGDHLVDQFISVLEKELKKP